MDKKRIFLNTIFWGFILWLFGYVLGFIFFAFIPQESIGWFIMPFGMIATFWILFKKIKRESFTYYIGLGIFWVIIAILLDYIFIVQLLRPIDGYYKLDVYLYYILIFILPLVVGWFKTNKKIVS